MLLSSPCCLFCCLCDSFGDTCCLFERHGWQGDAALEVTLLNDKYGFKFEEYGSSITVRRTIRRPSGGAFELLGHDKKVTTTRSVVDAGVGGSSWRSGY